MKKLTVFVTIICAIFAINAFAAEVVTKKKKDVVVYNQVDYIKLVNNFVVVADISKTMMRKFKGTTRIDAQKNILAERNEFIIEELNFNSALYTMTPWKELYAPGRYGANRFGQAIDQLPTSKDNKGMTTTGEARLGLALKTLNNVVLPKLTGATVVVLFTDGRYTPQATGAGITRKEQNVPIDQARNILRRHPDTSFLIVSSADPGTAEARRLKRIANLDPHSRVIPFEWVMSRPEYLGGVLFDIVHTRAIFLRTIDEVKGLDVANVRFAFNQDDIAPEFNDDLDALAQFLQSYPETIVELSGYTCNMGTVSYNVKLSRRRAEKVRDYLINNHGIDDDRIVTNWYSIFNPIGDNATAAGRALNRRVSIEVLGL